MPRVHRNNQLLALRQVLGLKQKDVAAALGVASDTLGRYEAGTRRITLELERKLACVFGVEPTSLYSVIRDQWGQPFSRMSWEAWKLLPEPQREQAVDIEVLLSAEIGRLVGSAKVKNKSGIWVGRILQLLREMAEDLNERPPIRVPAFDDPITLVPKEPRGSHGLFQLAAVTIEIPEKVSPGQNLKKPETPRK